MWKWILGSLSLIVLILGSHVFAYDLGRGVAHRRLDGLLRDTEAAVHEDAILATIESLEAATAHPEEAGAAKLSALRRTAETRVANVETISIPRAREAGDRALEIRLDGRVAAARKLLAKLPQP